MSLPILAKELTKPARHPENLPRQRVTPVPLKNVREQQDKGNEKTQDLGGAYVGQGLVPLSEGLQ